MLNECAADMWFAVELCEEVLLTGVTFANHQHLLVPDDNYAVILPKTVCLLLNCFSL